MKEMRIRKFIYAKACVNENFHLRAIYATCAVEIESMIANNRAGHRRPAPWTDHWRTWYQLERWRRLRRHQLMIEPLCAMCLQRGLVRPATVVDHVEPHRGNWNKFLTGKLQSLCEHCHNSDKRLVEQGEPRAIIGEDGWPT